VLVVSGGLTGKGRRDECQKKQRCGAGWHPARRLATGALMAGYQPAAGYHPAPQS